MQVNQISYIELLYPTTKSKHLHIYSKDSLRGVKQYSKQTNKFEAPNAFRWHDSHLRPLTPKLEAWLRTEFKHIFDYNPMLWIASVQTADPKFHPILEDLFND